MFAEAAELRSGHLEGPHRRPGGEASAWLVWHLRSVLLWGPRLETDQAETLPGAPRKPRPPREMALAEGQAPSGPGSRADRGVTLGCGRTTRRSEPPGRAARGRWPSSGPCPPFPSLSPGRERVSSLHRASWLGVGTGQERPAAGYPQGVIAAWPWGLYGGAPRPSPSPRPPPGSPPEPPLPA